VIPETLGEAGRLVTPGDPAELARACGELTANLARAREVGALGRARVRERFDRDALAERALGLLAAAREERTGHSGRPQRAEPAAGTERT
jgi:glycosyltransferase involved in cell wall biosynthesis